ncbi:rhodopsin [Trichoplax sp. H2]|nr:rhodopsin [Trichoplax sp. H2]|eukprot:RDD42762.1 rhodopsin [Trichoplax sp. H2]
MNSSNTVNNSFIPFSDFEANARFIAYAVLLAFTVIGNIIVIESFIVVRTLRTPFNIFLLNLATVDLFTGIFRMGFYLFNIAYAKGFEWPFSPALCNFSGWALSIAFSANVHTLELMAIFRYIAVVHNNTYNLTQKRAVISIVCIWIYSNIIALLPIIGWNRYRYQANEIACLPDWYYESSYPLFVTICDVIIPLTILFYCYVAIYITMKKTSRRFRDVSNQGMDIALQQISKREARVTRAMFLVFVAFLICIVPYAVCVFILFSIFHIWVGRDMAFLTGYFVNLNSAINPILYGFLYCRFRKAYYYTACLWWRKLSSIYTTLSSLHHRHNKVRLVKDCDGDFNRSRGTEIISMNHHDQAIIQEVD